MWAQYGNVTVTLCSTRLATILQTDNVHFEQLYK